MTRTKTLTLAGAVGLLLAAAPSTAGADQVKYVGVHPVEAGGVCYIEAPHVHTYRPAKSKKRVEMLYRVHDGHYHFVGDPVAHGYDGDKVSYYGPHPIAVDVVAGAHVAGAPHDVHYCYLGGPHFHAYAPAPDLTFELKGDAYWYVGAYPPEYERERAALVRINTVYEPIRYQRPVIEVEPPVAYVGPVIEVRPVAVEARVVAPAIEVEARAPVLEVDLVAPRLEVGIGLPGVVVIEEDHHHHHRVIKKKHRKHGKRRGRGHRKWHD